MSHISNSETNLSKPSRVLRVLPEWTKRRLPHHKRCGGRIKGTGGNNPVLSLQVVEDDTLKLSVTLDF